MSRNSAYGSRDDAVLALPEIEAAAGSLFDAERERSPRPPLTDEFPTMAIADAYRIQHAYSQLRLAGETSVIGNKIGATSAAIQRLFDIDTPDYGLLLDDMVIGDDGLVDADQLIQPKAEPELAFVLARDLRGPGVTVAKVLGATQCVRPCLEIIDSRITDWRIKLADTIADNGSSARVVLGADLVPLDGIELPTVEVVLRKNGDEVERATGAAVLGDPAISVAWLANALAGFGSYLPAGAIILSGSMTTAPTAEVGDRFEAEFPSLGCGVTCRFVAGGRR